MHGDNNMESGTPPRERGGLLTRIKDIILFPIFFVFNYYIFDLCLEETGWVRFPSKVWRCVSGSLQVNWYLFISRYYNASLYPTLVVFITMEFPILLWIMTEDVCDIESKKITGDRKKHGKRR
jgi:hypothetical protein